MIVFNGNLPLPDGTEVTIVPDPASNPAPPSSTNGHHVDPVFKIGDDAVDGGPADMADEHDHYAYGSPKRRNPKKD